MNALDNLNKAVIDLQATISALSLPIDNSDAIQAAADSINASVVALKNKVTPTV